MKVLLANDDGINAPGIAALAKRFSMEHEVYIVAPAANKSGASSSITVNVPHVLEKKSDGALASVAAYSLDGTPVDCVLSGVNGTYIPDVDVVISGINDGPNIGSDVIFSGTCGAARYASMMGIPGIALSVDTTSFRAPEDRSGDLYFDSLADFACKNLNRLIELCGERKLYNDRYIYDCFVNVNSPCLKVYKGVKLTSPSLRRYYDVIQLEKESESRFLSKCVGEFKCFSYGGEDADYKATGSGYVSVSSVHTEVRAVDLSGKENSFIL